MISIFYIADTDELSSGEYGDIVSKNKTEDTDLHGTGTQGSPNSTNIHAEIQKNYEELQQKLSQEFHKKLHEWERMKASSSASASYRGPSGEDGYHDKGFRRKMEEWERKHPQHSQAGDSKHRDSLALQLLDEDNLSPDFRKKLQVQINQSLMMKFTFGVQGFSIRGFLSPWHAASPGLRMG